jgi:hypothetical protein
MTCPPLALLLQRLYLYSSIIQLVAEIVFYETSECIIMNFVIPDLARHQVRSVGFALNQAVQNVWRAAETSAAVLDVPRFLFVST